MSTLANALPRDQIVVLLGLLTEALIASESDGTSQPRRASDRHTNRDPLVRALAATALHDLHYVKGLSYREIAAMYRVSHARVHQLMQDVAGLDAASAE